MNNGNGYRFPVYIAKGVATSGHFTDLGPLVLGIFDAKTYSVATASGNGKEFFLAGGSPHTRDRLSKWQDGMQNAKKSSQFYGKDIISFEKAFPGRPQNEEWTLGYGGGEDDTTLGFEKGKFYQLKIRLYGEPAFNRFNKSLEKVISLPSTCNNVDPCVDDCAAQTAEIKAQTIKWAELINNHPELMELQLKAYPVFSDYVATAPNSFVYQISVTDNGDVQALQNVQRAYTGTDYFKRITRLSYANGTSIYQVIGLTAAPDDFTPTSEVLLSLCNGACPPDYTETDGFDTYLISRPVTPSTDLDDATAQGVYAATIVTAYSGIADSGVFLGLTSGDNAVANVKINVTSGATVVPINSDVVEQLASTPARCTPSAADAIEWVSVDSGYTTVRTLKATFPTQDCVADITEAGLDAALQAIYPSYVADSATETTSGSDNCVQTFEIQQISDFMQDLCMSPDVAVYADKIISYRGVVFEVVPEDFGDTTAVKAGLRFTAPFYSAKFDDCSFDPEEFYDYKPLHMEVSIWDQSGDVCSLGTQAKARRTKDPKYSRLTGEFVIREYLRQSYSKYFKFDDWSNDPRMREVIDNTILSQIDRNGYYIAYYLKFKTSQDKERDQKGEFFEVPIYVNEKDVTVQNALETALQQVTARFGVGLEQRGPINY